MSGPTQGVDVPLAASSASPLFRSVTWGVPALVLAVALIPDEENTPLLRGAMVALALVLFALFQLAPRRLAYTLTPDAVVIQRILNQTRLPYAGLSARRTSGVLGVRTFGTGMPGYLTGHFTLSHDGQGVSRVLAAASTGQGGVLLHSGDADYFLTPADPQVFLAELARRGAGVAA
ncbi:PH domain-containing protein [Deinococcus marmoris]|uniref:PH domain-containing protein n=1 Tax=Deinococcus marmoris TaxID=249408 RepID=UPI0012DE59B5|nr:PH domain-containing protein [Deinococcus marmoris]